MKLKFYQWLIRFGWKWMVKKEKFIITLLNDDGPDYAFSSWLHSADDVLKELHRVIEFGHFDFRGVKFEIVDDDGDEFFDLSKIFGPPKKEKV